MDRYQKINNTAPIQTALKANKVEVKRSNFDLSRVKHTSANIGEIIPIDLIETMPNDHFNILDYIINLEARNPTVKKQLTGMRVYVHAYYNRWSDLWEGANNFVDRGQSGKITLQMPTLRTQFKYETNKTLETTTPMSLSNYLDVPATIWKKTRDRINQGWGCDSNSDRIAPSYGNETINALPYVMYQKLYLEKYAPRNLIQNNKNWVPDNQRHFILPYNANIVSQLDYNTPDVETIDGYITSGDIMINPNGALAVPESVQPNTPVWLNSLHYRQKKGDYFNTALPFSNLIRGDTPTISLANLDWSEAITTENDVISNKILAVGRGNKIIGITTNKGNVGTPTYTSQGNITYGTATGGTGSFPTIAKGNGTENITGEGGNALLEALNQVKVQANIDAFTIAQLEILSAIKIRNGLTNGRYNEQVKAQFNYNPESPTTDGIYIGGGYFDLGQSGIVQQSESNQSPLGTLAGRLEGSGICKCGSFHCKDYGYIMVLLSIVPDQYYKQGLDKHITKKLQEEVYVPLSNELAPQPIKNKEILWQGNAEDEDLFGWTERNSEYKQRRNKVSGLLEIDELDDSRYLSSETFSNLPTLSNSFVSLSRQNVDMGIFTTTNEPPFILTVGSYVKATRPLPYASIPKALKEN